MNTINESFISDLREKTFNNITRSRINVANGLNNISNRLTSLSFNPRVQQIASAGNILHNAYQAASGNIGPEDMTRLPSTQHNLLAASSILHNAANKVQPSPKTYWKMKLSKL